MQILDFFTAALMLFIGLIVGAAVAAIAGLFGIAGWIAGGVFAALVLGIFYLNNKMMGLELRWLVRLLQKAAPGQVVEDDTADLRETFSDRKDYCGFVAGVLVGAVASSIWTPGAFLDFLNI